MDLAVLIKLFTALKDWLRIHVVLGHKSDCKLISHQKRAAKHHKHVSCLPDSDQRKKMETHSDTPTIMMKTITKFWFFKKKETVFHSICIKNVCLFLLLCIPETCFLFLFFSLIPAPPHPSLSSLFPFFYFVFVSFCCSPNFLSGFNFHVPALSQTTCSPFSTTPCDFPYLFVFFLFIFILKFEIRQLRAHLAQQDLDLAAEREAAMQIHHVWDKQGRNFQVVEGLPPGESDDEGGQRNPREPHVTSGIV